MVAHSKRNTSLAFFTAYERSLLSTAWGSQRTRLSRDSFLPFGSCSLCLLPARDPVACPNGDVFCKECALNNILAQRQEIKRLEKEMERRKEDELEAEGRDEEEVRERAVREFELVQLGIESKVGGLGNKKIVGREGGKIQIEEDEDHADPKKRGAKRKFELDETELLRIAKEDRTKYRKELDDEKKAAAHNLPSFWVPGHEVDAATANPHTHAAPTKLSPLCPSSSEHSPHKLSLKNLTPIDFTQETDSTTKQKTLTCPACRKALSNATHAVMAIPCGHVLCKPCIDKFMKPVMTPDPHNPELEHSVLRCFVCEIDLTGEDTEATSTNAEAGGVKKKKKKSKKDKDSSGVKPGLVDLKSEGTGFASGGNNLVKKTGVVFQC
ncbi:Bifunctional purine biosynthesis protein [Venturia nashicola]|uniref:Bifunctional purine biosynthesis protein n=1 Tax=Venturia nashicola TaxID=86259 RepID=A0A4Z1NVK5_9PEZI|nr:Bifunctional purine biosynthesis protein [Venturia nashicola]TLD21575.1 Bifunctional purine biosynthesis protein [Venturia nashicola]